MAEVGKRVTTHEPMDVEKDIPIETATQEPEIKLQDAIVDGLFTLCKQLATSSGSSDVYKVLLQVGNLRPELTKENLTIFLNILCPNEFPNKQALLKYITKKKAVVDNEEYFRNQLPIEFYYLSPSGTEILIKQEILLLVGLLIQLYLLDSNLIAELNNFNKNEIIQNLFNKNSTISLSDCDLLTAKIWFNIQLADEKLNNKADYTIIEHLLDHLKFAVLKHQPETQVSIICGILRAYLVRGDILSASEFVSKVEYPENFNISTSLEARYLFYMAKIFAIQLDYETANEYIVSAIRKAPLNDEGSKGFLQIAYKLKCVVDLLLGNIPELSFFKNKVIEGEVIKPYFLLTKSVKLGDINNFTNIINKYKSIFHRDDLHMLSTRLRSNVLRAGMKNISKTYSKIHLRDICHKLKLDSEQTTEYIVAKCIKENVIDAKIDYETSVVETFKENVLYETREPQDIFDQRIYFANQIKNDCLKSLNYPKKDRKEPAAGEDEEDIFAMNPETLSSLLNDFYEDDFDEDF